MSAGMMITDKQTDLVKRLEASYSGALPKHVTREQFSRAFLTAVRQDSKIMECTPKSIAGAVVTAAQLGLMIGLNGACWLIPFKNKQVMECQLIIGYQGLIDLCYRSGQVESISADVVCENDHFKYRQGLDQVLDHTPELRGPRGAPYAVYAIARIKESKAPVFVVLSKDEVMQVKKASRAATSSMSPWNGPFENEMWKKTAIRRLVKLLPQSVELSEALEFENRQEERWADADVVEDPFAKGRHSTSRREKKTEVVMDAPQEPQDESMDEPAEGQDDRLVV